MRLMFVLFLMTTSVFAQDVNCEASGLSKIVEVIPAQSCIEFITSPYDLQQEDQMTKAKQCQVYFISELEKAMLQITKRKKTACDYLDLKEQVNLYNNIVSHDLGAKSADAELVAKMKEYYDIMYSDQNTNDCDGTALADILFEQYQIKNIEVPEQA